MLIASCKTRVFRKVDVTRSLAFPSGRSEFFRAVKDNRYCRDGLNISRNSDVSISGAKSASGGTQ